MATFPSGRLQAEGCGERKGTQKAPTKNRCAVLPTAYTTLLSLLRDT